MRPLVIGLARYLMVQLAGRPLGYYVLNEYPRSGGTWIAQMLAAALEVPFPKHRIPGLQPSVVQLHYVRLRRSPRMIVVWRDGRDVMVSWYHNCMVSAESYNPRHVARMRRDLGNPAPDEVREHLAQFIEYTFTRAVYPRFTWAEFVQKWAGDPDILHVTYERFHADPAAELRRAVQALTGEDVSLARAQEIAEAHAFRRQSGRDPGQENKASLQRKGIVGDWRNVFDRSACEVFDALAGKELVRLGYEPDREWVNAAQLADPSRQPASTRH